MWRIVENHSLFRVFQNASAIMTIARASALRLSLNCIPYPQQILDLTRMGMYTVSFSETNPYIYIFIEGCFHICHTCLYLRVTCQLLSKSILMTLLLLQASLSKLMETLDQAEPYFVKCIRSNAEKVKVFCIRQHITQVTS